MSSTTRRGPCPAKIRSPTSAILRNPPPTWFTLVNVTSPVAGPSVGAGGTVGVGDGSAAVALAEGRVCVGAMETVAIGIAVAERVPVLMGVDNAVGFNVALGGLSVP